MMNMFDDQPLFRALTRRIQVKLARSHSQVFRKYLGDT